MDIDLKLKGYRCFSPDSPAKIEFRGDVMALVSINNSGKSTLLKALYELRPIFLALTQKEDYRRFAIMSDAGLELPTELGDPAEIFWHFGNADIEIGIKLPGLRPTIPEPDFINPVLDYDFGPQFNYVDGSGVPSIAPPQIKQVLKTYAP